MGFFLANILPFELIRMFYEFVSLLVTSLFAVHIQWVRLFRLSGNTDLYSLILCSVDHASRYNCVKKPNLMYNLFLVYSVNLYLLWAYLGPSWGGTVICIQQLVLIILFRLLIGKVVFRINLHLFYYQYIAEHLLISKTLSAAEQKVTCTV